MVEQVINENSINITSYQYKTKRIGDSNTKLLNQDKLKALLKTNPGKLSYNLNSIYWVQKQLKWVSWTFIDNTK